MARGAPAPAVLTGGAWQGTEEACEERDAPGRARMLRRGGNLQTCRFDSRPVGAAIILWNTVYIAHAVHELRTLGQAIDDDLLAHLAPLGLEHINLTGDYEWNPSSLTEISELRPLRLPASNLLLAA